MDVILQARELGKAIQRDSRFIAYNEAKLRNDGDAELQDLIGEFNLLRQNIQMEMARPEDEKDDEKIAGLNTKMRTAYEGIMGNANMAKFTEVKSEVDKMLNEINQIISLCCEGEDPDTCQPNENCGGSCESCAGCG